MRCARRVVVSVVALLLVAVTFVGCENMPTDVTVYWCAVDGDTIGVPNDTTGVRCGALPGDTIIQP